MSSVLSFHSWIWWKSSSTRTHTHTHPHTNLDENLHGALHLLEVFQNWKEAICSVYGCATSACFCVCLSVFVYVCVYSAHLLLVCDASDGGHNPELQTGSQGSARGRETPAGGTGWEKYPSKLEWWYSRAKPLNTLSPHFSLCPHYQPCRWEDMQWTSLTPKANECEFPIRWLVPKYSLISVVTVTKLGTKNVSEEAHRSPRFLAYFYHKGPGCAGMKQSRQTMWQDGASSLSEKLS